ncbi:hypothetical protein V8E54_005850, partial [Elaphomyces granulatus]
MSFSFRHPKRPSFMKNRDPLAPSDLSNEQLQTIRRHPEILELRREGKKLKEEI